MAIEKLQPNESTTKWRDTINKTIDKAQSIESDLSTRYTNQQITSSDTFSKFGLTDNSIPDNVLNRLKNAILYQNNAFQNVLGNNITIPAAQLSERVQIGTGTYTGTASTTGSHTLYFSFSPKIVIVYNRSEPKNDYAIFGAGANRSLVHKGSGTSSIIGYELKHTLSGNTLSWNLIDPNTGGESPLNAYNNIYAYVAIG